MQKSKCVSESTSFLAFKISSIKVMASPFVTHTIDDVVRTISSMLTCMGLLA